MARSVVRIPPHVRPPFEVYLNGVRQELGADYTISKGALVFDRDLKKDHVSGWRWLIGSFGFSTYRQDDSVDIRFTRPDGTLGVAQRLEIEPG